MKNTPDKLVLTLTKRNGGLDTFIWIVLMHHLAKPIHLEKALGYIMPGELWVEVFVRVNGDHAQSPEYWIAGMKTREGELYRGTFRESLEAILEAAMEKLVGFTPRDLTQSRYVH